MKAIKKFLLCILCLAALSAAVFGLSACSEEEPTECSHSWNSWETLIAPTCQAEGLERRVCKLDSTHIEERTTPKLDHSFENYVSNNDATCSNNGTKTAYCKTLGCTVSNTVEDAGSQLPHKFTERIVNDDYLLSKASCTKPAKYYYSCECGACGTETFDEGDILHSFGKTFVYDEDSHWYECKVCETKIEKESHNWGEGKPESTATCTENGKTVYTCEDCGATKEIVEPAHHTLVYIAKVPATCTSEGSEAHWRCSSSDCGKKFSDDKGENEITNIKLPIVAHSYTAWNYDKEFHSRKCEWCDDILPETVKHVFVDGFDSKSHYTACECGYRSSDEEHKISIKTTADAHWDECTECNYVSDMQQHTNAPRYSNSQHWNACTYCNYSSAKEAHVYDEGVETIAPTCTEFGVKTYTCKCGSSYTEALLPGHKYGELIPAVDSTCTETGVMAHYDCTVCGKSFVDQNGKFQDLTIPLKKHNFSEIGYSDDGHWKECSECGFKNTETPVVHTLVPGNDENQHWDECQCGYKKNVESHFWGVGAITTPVSCFEDGERTYTCYCGETKTEAIPHHNMTVVEAKEATTCTDGNKAYIRCEVCINKYYMVDDLDNPFEVSLEEITIPAQHNYEDADMDWDDNYHWYICKDCEDHISDKESHSFKLYQDFEGNWFICEHEGCEFKKKIEQ